MALLDTVLRDVGRTPGVTSAVLLDGVTGLSYAEYGAPEPAQDAQETAHSATMHLNKAGFTGELESIVVTTAAHHHVTVHVDRQGDPLLLFALVDRDRTNITWALRDLAAHTDRLLA
ncbi:MAG: hypothetical protein JF597_32445 [Streptomyces sp.]|jgi:hypothetical protein|uniref:hypothetical protein n=1 Tax=Streptomyces sp. TaxID=1931 RepID=UPI0025CC1517|nr:hypothetical protein [Streptomyces sp.]MBW8798131.1 hypothetical protein [Streptomyces sp.]